MKKENTQICAIYAAQCKARNIANPIHIRITWFEENLKRDIDNVASSIKFILDGLVNAGVLQGDNRKWVRQITHSFPEPDKTQPRVEVELETIE